MKISKYAILLSGILAFVLTITGILFLISGLVYQNYQVNDLANYLLISGTVLIVLALFFIAGIISLKKHFERARRLLMSGSLLFILAGVLPVRQLIVSIPVASTRLFILIFALLLYIPFLWLFYYLWKLKKTH